MQPLRTDNTLRDEARKRVDRAPRRIEDFRDETQDEITRFARPRRREPEAAREVQIAVAHVSLRDFLHSRDAVRRAIVLHEIIGPPRALREDEW
jgi:hypothetical protein